MIGREPVVDRHHATLSEDSNRATQMVVGVEIADDPPAAVTEHDHRVGSFGDVQPNRYVVAAGQDREIDDLRQVRPDRSLRSAGTHLLARGIGGEVGDWFAALPDQLGENRPQAAV
ncbi:MAG: hypothetical protein QOI90_470 [Mycobacterium sp.]|jgi:hypothetical protein|nr:hypothetical protein [Mycobacterium sp.]